MGAPAWIGEAADILEEARTTGQTVPLLSERFPELDLEAAYAILIELSRRREARGDEIVGVKLGAIDPAAQRKLGIDGPVRGFLHASGRLAPADLLPGGVSIHAEPELVVVAARRGSGGDWAVDTVAPGIEVDSSRYHPGLFNLVDVVADSAWAGWYRIGEPRVAYADLAPRNPTLTFGDSSATSTCQILRDGDAGVVDPVRSLHQIDEGLVAHGMQFRPEWFVFTGGLIDPVAITPSGVRADFEHLGTVEVASEPAGGTRGANGG